MSEASAPGGMLPADPRRGVRRLAVATTVATLVLISMGGAVRATDSGLACPDWPACYGQWIPPADLNMWLEHSHRLWAGVVGLAIVALVVLSWRHRDVPRLWRLSAVALGLVVIQAGLGAAVVLLHLRAGLVTSHLGMSWIIVACLVVVAIAARDPRSAPEASSHERLVARDSAVVAVLVLLQGLLGGQATGRGAAYVYNAVPIWLSDQQWTGHSREVLHLTHRFAGYLVAAAVVVYAVRALRRARRADGRVPAWTMRLPQLAVVLVLIQVGFGITNVLTRATVWSGIAHLTVASWLWTVLVLAAALGWRRARVPGAPTPETPGTQTSLDSAGPTGPGTRPSGEPEREVVR